MIDENEKEVSRKDTENVVESLFGEPDPDAADGAGEEEAAAVKGANYQERGSEAADEPAGEDESGSAGSQTSPEASTPAEEEADTSDDLKVVLTIRGGISTIGVQRPSADPHVESVAEPEISGIVGEVPAVIARARARWEEAPKYPSYERPARSTGRRPRRGAPSAEASAAGEGTAQDQQETLRLF